MKKYTFLLALFLSVHLLIAQNAINIGAIQSIAQAREYVSSNSNAELIILNSGKDSSEAIRRLGATRSFEDSTYYYKLIDSSSELSFRARYVYLDGNKLSKKKIDSLRKVILTKYNSGTSFTELVATYNMDGNRNQGDLGWFTEGMMEEKFESGVRTHKKGDIFTLDIKYRKWYYVVLKTHDNTEIQSYRVLRVRK